MPRDLVETLRQPPQFYLGILGFSGRGAHFGVWQCLAWVPAQPFISYMVLGQFLHLPELQSPHLWRGGHSTRLQEPQYVIHSSLTETQTPQVLAAWRAVTPGNTYFC